MMLRFTWKLQQQWQNLIPFRLTLLKKKNTYRNHPYRRRPPAAGGGDGGDLHAHILKSCTFYVINPELHKPELPETSKYLTAAFLAGDVHQSQGIFSFF